MIVHPVTELFPAVAGAELASLADDIRRHGLREPIWTYEGQILDGRARYLACQQARVEPHYREWNGQGSVVELVIGLNLVRRHLTVSQRAMIAARMVPMLEEEAQGRMKAGKAPDPGANLRGGKAAAIAGGLLGVSGRSVDSARRVLKEGSAALVEAVDRGRQPVSAAAQLAGLTDAEQVEVLRGVEEDALRARAEGDRRVTLFLGGPARRLLQELQEALGLSAAEVVTRALGELAGALGALGVPAAAA